jgi:hypothetical protein
MGSLVRLANKIFSSTLKNALAYNRNSEVVELVTEVNVMITNFCDFCEKFGDFLKNQFLRNLAVV